MGRFRMIASGWLLLVLTLFFSADGAAAANPERTVAILSVDAGASASLADGLTAAMSGDSSVRLVDRDSIARVLREQELSAAGLTAGSRVKLGRLLGADILVLLAANPVAGANAVNLLLCESPTGARIGQVDGAFSAANLPALAGEIRRVLARFPHGIEAVVAVPDLISEDLRLARAGLQSTLTDLLRDELERDAGVALVEFNEARAIAGEHELTGGDVRRIVPLYVEGKYRTDDFAPGGPTISISIALRMAQHEDVKLESGQIALSAASAFIVDSVPARIRELLRQPAVSAIDAGEEFARLVRRADEFAQIGDFDRAADLREAALLLKPDADGQRIRVLLDYNGAGMQLTQVWPKGAHRDARDAWWQSLVARRRETWRRSLVHVEYLVRNRRVDIVEGTRLVNETIHSITIVRGTEILPAEEDLKKEVIRNLAPALLSLSGRDGRPASQDQLMQAASCLIECALFRVDGNFIKEDDLTLVGDLLCNVFPDNTPVVMNMLYVLHDGTRRFGGTDRDVSPDVWLRFLQRLLDSPRPVVHAYGQIGQFSDQLIRQKRVTEALLAEAQALEVAARMPPLRSLDPQGDLSSSAAQHAAWIDIDLHHKKLTPTPASAPVAASPAHREPGPDLQPDGSFVCQRVRLKPVQLVAGGSANPLPGGLPGNASRAIHCDELVPAWDGVDVIYSRNAVSFWTKDGNCHQVLFEEHAVIGSVVFDGRYVWVSTGFNTDERGNEIQALDRQGSQIPINLTDGLPESFAPMPLLPLAPGRIMVGGSIQQGRRGWLATVELDSGRPRVHVFHEGIKLPVGYVNLVPRRIPDPDISFVPGWFAEHRDENNRRWVFVGCSYDRKLLVVNADTLDVSVYPVGVESHDCFPRSDPGFGAFLSYGGLLYVAGSQQNFKVCRFDSASQILSEAFPRPDNQWHYGNATQGSLVAKAGFLYYAGNARWLRYPLGGGPEEVLVSEPRSLPHYGSADGWTLGNSQVAGLVAWRVGQLYQVTVEPGPGEALVH